MYRRFLIVLFTLMLTVAVYAPAQDRTKEGPTLTQALVRVEEKSSPPNATAVTVKVNGRKQPVSDWQPISQDNAQVALLIDDGLRESIGRELENLRGFIRALPPGVEVMVGFMQHGSVVSDGAFTADHVKASNSIRLPNGVPGSSASPYMCLSDFVKHWPGITESTSPAFATSVSAKARFVLMLTNGVDPYNGSTSIMNQDSPYVDAAIADTQRAGVVVYSIYFGDAGIRGRSADNSGQNYLNQLAQATGGVNYWQGAGNPVSTAPFLDNFRQALKETYIASFTVPQRVKRTDLVSIKFSAPGISLHSAQSVAAGNQE